LASEEDKMKLDKRNTYSYAFELGLVIIGLALNYLDVGNNRLFSFPSVGYFLIYVGFVGLFITTVKAIRAKERKVDERMMAAALQSARITFMVIILVAFIIMIADGISPIHVAYSTFMSYFVCFIILSNLVTYKLLLKFKY
jgi:Co/Zn/Cd efflux system component